jgi:hypothetical protein
MKKLSTAVSMTRHWQTRGYAQLVVEGTGRSLGQT